MKQNRHINIGSKWNKFITNRERETGGGGTMSSLQSIPSIPGTEVTFAIGTLCGTNTEELLGSVQCIRLSIVFTWRGQQREGDKSLFVILMKCFYRHFVDVEEYHSLPAPAACCSIYRHTSRIWITPLAVPVPPVPLCSTICCFAWIGGASGSVL